MKAEQISFAAGEISPVLHARTDLTRYRIALAELVNMIVLPQGGVTRRAGIEKLNANISESTVKLIPFEYNTTDSAMLVFAGGRMHVVQVRDNGDHVMLAVNISTPYTAEEVKDLRYIQSGNVMFLTHKNHKPMMLRRDSLNSWILQELPFRGGPWINGEEWYPGAKLKITGSGNNRAILSDDDVFSSGLEGTLLKVEYAVPPKTMELTSKLSPKEEISESFEVKGTLNVTTAGEWQGTISIDRSADGGQTWVTVRQYVRKDTETQGQWDFTISETEENVLYRVRARHETVETTKNAPTETSILNYGGTETIKSSSSVEIDNSNLGTESDTWIYNQDKTLRTNADRTIVQYRVITTDANGNYTTIWRNAGYTPDNMPDSSIWVN